MLLQARGTELLQLHQDMADVVPRLTAAVQAGQEWQARHEQCAQQLRDSQEQLQGSLAARAALQETLDGQTAGVQQLNGLISAKQKEVERVRAADAPCCLWAREPVQLGVAA